ncbi:hypothetical protein BAE44_0021884 [Dichanthelium oligosanthes]|uniref:Uncharacterized protein n=1 Tax=Dichanthelium oligosanthes TaxID=888268 RepID=A0A1E5UW82_9POAL|nr:hypothetical protein BAE44_0021884 [Dichanthelium oligosanthes]
MDYDNGGASPDPYGGGGGSIHLVCGNCGSADDYSADDVDDGFFTCRTCAAVHTSTQATAADPHFFPAIGNISVRCVATQPRSKLGTQTPAPYPRTPHATPGPTPAPAGAAFDDFVEPSEPRDFTPVAGEGGSPRIWRRGCAGATCGGSR